MPTMRECRAIFPARFSAALNRLGVRCRIAHYRVIWVAPDGFLNYAECNLYPGRISRFHDIAAVRASVNVETDPSGVCRRGGPRYSREGPNKNIEVTVLPGELPALAEWLPQWLMHRADPDHYVPPPPPPPGLEDLLKWEPHHQHVYQWSTEAGRQYDWWAERKGLRKRPGGA